MNKETKATPQRDKDQSHARVVPPLTNEGLLEIMLANMESTGYDGYGKNGVAGYLEMLASRYPKEFDELMGHPEFIIIIFNTRERILASDYSGPALDVRSD
jgi:hypothetical protein